MNLKKTPLTLWMSFSVITVIWACNSQGNRGNVQTPHIKESNQIEDTSLDQKAVVIYRDKKNHLWFLSKEKGVYQYDGQNLTLYTSNDGLGSYRIISIQEDNEENLYFDTPNNVYKFDGEKFTALSITDESESEPEWTTKPGDLWFRMGWDKKGPYKFDGKKLYHLEFPKNRMEDEFYRDNPTSSINPYAIYSMYKDSKERIWFGTSNMGVYMLSLNELSWNYEKHWIETPEGGNFGVRSIAEDQDGIFWISNAQYKYALQASGNTSEGLQSINFKRKVGIEKIEKENLYFYSMETDKNGNLLMFAGEDGLWINNGIELKPFYIQEDGENISPLSMYKDRHGILWFGTDQNGIYQYDGNSCENFKIK